MTSAAVEPFSLADLQAMWRVLAAWVRASKTRGSVGTNLARQLQQFPPVSDSVLEHTVAKAGCPLQLQSYGWVIGGPLPRYGPPVVPIATAAVDDVLDGRVSEARLRVALLRERADHSLHSEGWRFESREVAVAGTAVGGQPASGGEAAEDDSRPPHPYAHAQAIYGWRRDSPCLIHPPHGDDDPCDGIDPIGGDGVVDSERLCAKRATLDTHPAFPLPAQTLAGLALAVVATLYGAGFARNIVDGDRLLGDLGDQIAQDLRVLQGDG